MGNKLTYYDRQQIAHWHRIGLNAKQIAEKIHKDRTVIWRELKRNAGYYLPYDADRAQHYAYRRTKKTNRRILEKDSILREYVIRQLEQNWSPEQIAGRIKKYPPSNLVGKHISHEAIYQYIYAQEPWLYHKLRKSHSNRQPQCQRKKRSANIPDKVSIEHRPEGINNRREIGHFESDSMVGKNHQSGLSVQYERKIKLVFIAKLDSFTAETTNEALKTTIESLPINFAKSMTFDNGSENAKHMDMKNIYNIDTYFCDPYKAWQKGGVENTIGLIRQYFPKGTSLTDVTDERIEQIQRQLNDRPRKTLDFKTPNELLIEYKGKSEMLH